MNMIRKHIRQMAKMALLLSPLVFAACGSKKNLVTENNIGNNTVNTTNTGSSTTPSEAKVSNSTYLAKVINNASTQNAMVANIDFNLKSGKKDITVDGKLSMKRGEVVRIQLTPMGLMEVGRLEFTKDSVLIMDRIHKQYLKSSYDQVSFLKNNGIDFNALQALFWNQLFLPGEKSLGEKQLDAFKVEGTNISYQKGKMDYLWKTDKEVEQLISALATYTGTSSGKSSIGWDYSDFKTFGGKPFPAYQLITLDTNARGSQKVINVGLKLKSMKADSDWDTVTKVSGKYKPVKLEDVINQILKIQ
jgi:hypothetical protein